MKEKKASQESQSRTMLYIQMINKYMKFKLMFVFVTWGWFTSGLTPNYQWSTVIYIWCANGGSPTVGQQRLSGHANGGPTTHLSFMCTVGPTVGQRWVNRGLPVASHHWPNSALIVGVPLGHRWANGG